MKKSKHIAISIILALVLTLSVIGFVHSEEYPELNSELIGAEEGIAYSDLNLPTTVDGITGAISWTAKSDSLIEITGETGKILKYNVGEAYNTSVTATLENGDTKEIPFKVGYRADTENMSEVFGENFNGQTYEGSMGKATNDTVTHADGKLTLTRVSQNVGKRASSFVYNFPNSYSGIYAFEWTVTAGDGVGSLKMSLPLPTADTSPMAHIIISSAGAVNAYNGGTQKKNLTTLTSRENVKIKVVANTNIDKQCYDLYINDNPVAKNFGFRYTGGTSIPKMRIWFDKTEAAATVVLDDIKVYAPDEILGDVTRKIVNNGEDGAAANGDLYLPAKTLGKYDVVYESLEGNVNIEGEYGRIRGSYTEETSETVTASCEVLGVTYYREMYFKIPVSSLPKPIKDTNGKEIFNTNEDFSSFDTSKIVTSSAFSDSEFYLEDGKFIVEKTGTGGGDNNVMIPLNTPADYKGKNLVIEFELMTEKPDTIVISPVNRHANNGRFGNIKISGANVTIEQCDTTLGSYAESSNGINTKVFTSFKTDRNFKFVIKISQTEDKKDARWSLWINGARVAKNLPARQPSFAQILNYLKFSNGGGATNKLTIDNFRVYEAEDSPIEAVEDIIDNIEDASDLAEVNEESGEIVGNIKVPEGVANVEITDSKGLILPDGTVKFQAHPTSDVITVTASYDGYTDEKEIVATIASNYILGEASIEGLDLERYLICKIPAELRRDEEEDETVKVLLSVYDEGGNLICEELSAEHKVMIDGENHGLIGYIEELPDIPQNPVVKLTVYSSSDDFDKPVTNLTVYGN